MPAGQTITLGPVWLSAEQSGFDALERYGDAVAALAPQPARTGAAGVWCSWYPIRMGINEELSWPTRPLPPNTSSRWDWT